MTDPRPALSVVLIIIINGVTVLPVDAPTPTECDRATRKRLIVTAPNVDDAVYALTAQTRALGGDTLKLTRTARRPGQGLAEGYPWICGTDAAEEAR